MSRNCQECERKRKYMASDPEMYRDEDWRCTAHQHAAALKLVEGERDAALEMLRQVLVGAECYDTGPAIPNSDRDDGLRACCPWCGAWANGHDKEPHEDDCEGQAARALLAKGTNGG